MGDLSRNFNRSEFACKCGCGFDTPAPDLVDLLQAVRDQFGPVVITSGCRCPSHNKRIGGAPKSYHMTGQAADIRAVGWPDKVVYEWLRVNYPGRFGFILEPSWVHIDVRGGAPLRKVIK